MRITYTRGISVFHKRPLDKASSRIWNSEKSEEWRDFAGGYGIQTPFGKRAVKRIIGDYDNVVGLPLKLLREKLKDIGVNIEKESD